MLRTLRTDETVADGATFREVRRYPLGITQVLVKGLVISDHIPHMVGGRYASEALAVGYMQGLRQVIEHPIEAPTHD